MGLDSQSESHLWLIVHTREYDYTDGHIDSFVVRAKSTPDARAVIVACGNESFNEETDTLTVEKVTVFDMDEWAETSRAGHEESGD